MASAKPTTDRGQIRKWVEARGGHPARVKRTGRGKDPGILRIDFPGFSGEDTLEEIGWDEFFEWFDRNNLAMLLSSERGNRFNKLVERAASKRSSAKKPAARKASAKKASSSRKPSGSRTAGTKSSAKKSSAKKASAKKASAKKSSAKKAGSSRKAASASKKASTKKASSRKATSAKRSAAGAKKGAARKSASTKASAKKASAGKSPAKRAAAKRSTGSAPTTTTNHDEIRRWVEARGGFPATVAGTEGRGQEAGLLRIDYPGYSGQGTLERIGWDTWFQKFDEENLAFLYQDRKNSRFSKLVRR